MRQTKCKVSGCNVTSFKNNVCFDHYKHNEGFVYDDKQKIYVRKS